MSLIFTQTDNQDLMRVYEQLLTEFERFKKDFKRRADPQVRIEDYEMCLAWFQKQLRQKNLIN